MHQLVEVRLDDVLGILLAVAYDFAPLFLTICLDLHEVFPGNDEDEGLLVDAHDGGLVRRVTDAVEVAKHDVTVVLPDPDLERSLERLPSLEHGVVSLRGRCALQK